MSGKAPIEIFEYNEEGKYIQKFTTQAEVRAYYYSGDIGKRPIITFERLGIKFGKTPEGNYLFKKRLGREQVTYIHKVYMCEYSTDLIKKEKKVVQVFNLEGTLLLEARNVNILSKITGISNAALSSQLNRKEGLMPKKNMPGGLIYKFKENESDL